MLLAREQLGRHLTRPWSVVLAGRINVGKSSLLNALAGYGRAIVHPAPGTTRDAVAVTTAVDGWPVELCDTAGLRATGDAIERAGIERARQRLAQADLVVLVADRSVPWSPEDEGLARQYPAAVLVHNKCDLPASSGHRPGGISTSALRGQGIDALLTAIGRRLAPIRRRQARRYLFARANRDAPQVAHRRGGLTAFFTAVGQTLRAAARKGGRSGRQECLPHRTQCRPFSPRSEKCGLEQEETPRLPQSQPEPTVGRRME